MQFVLYEILFYIKWETLKTMSVYFIFNYVWGVIYRIGQVYLSVFLVQIHVLFWMHVKL